MKLSRTTYQVALGLVGAVITSVCLGAHYHNGAGSVVAKAEITVLQADAVVDNSLVKLNAPTEARVGELVVLDVSASDVESFEFKVIPETKNFIVDTNDKRAVFSSETPGEYLFIVAGAKDGKVSVVTHKIIVAGGTVTPGTPVIATLDSQVKTWADPVVSATKRDEALKLAQSFTSVASIVEQSVASGQLMSIDDIVAATVTSNKAALGTSLDAWAPFRTGLSAYLKSRADAGELSDMASHVATWKAIAVALESYAATL